MVLRPCEFLKSVRYAPFKVAAVVDRRIILEQFGPLRLQIAHGHLP
ncbi:hypothetical protein GLE_5496 [Lysobacter enzymogenes]|uniref:Uncharacterized protein n=1 Tax=Lysobacter enzymogenes TaxID=69 RepID=A0A0S2DQR7_LYSEN|nr:hypothetical protein GLE_5496 [Lysobacter enzymogenes]